MTRAARVSLALCAFFVPAGLIAGCGGVPGNGVATVDGTTIEKSDFDQWMNTVAKSSGQAGATVPDAPNYTKCVQQKQKTQPKPAKGQPKVTAAQLKDQCKQQYETLRDQTMTVLLQLQWIEGEAEQQGVKVTDAEVRKSFDAEKKQSFPKDADYQKYLKDSGLTEQDILDQFRVRLLSDKIRDKIVKGKDKVTDAQIKAYYDKNKQQFAQPERRDLRVVLTKTEAEANQAKKALQGGDSWSSVAKEYSIDPQSKSQGGKLPGVSPGTQEKAFDDAIFDAKEGQLEGPVKTQFGYYVFEVESVKKATQQSLEQSKETIKQVLVQQNQDNAIKAFSKDFEKEWREKTECRESFETPQCKNGPDPTPTPDPAQQQQQVPQQGGQQAPQQVPQQGGQQAPQQVPEGGGEGQGQGQDPN